jgi:hypothetical protein
LNGAEIAEAARILGALQVLPVRFDSWAHFAEGAADLRSAFAAASLADLLGPNRASSTTRGVDLVEACVRRYRGVLVPDPSRQAHPAMFRGRRVVIRVIIRRRPRERCRSIVKTD